MPTFEISLSDGRKFHVDAADQDAAQADLLKHIQQPQQAGGVLDAVKQGASGLLSGFGETASRDLGLTGVGDALKNAGQQMAPQHQADTTLYDEQGFHPGNIGNALAESLPTGASALAAMRLMPGPIWAKLAAGGVVGLGALAGNYAREATAKRTGDANAPSNTEDLLTGGARALPEAALQSIPLGRFVGGPAARLGLKGVVGSAGRGLLDAAGMAAGGAGANAYDQAFTNGNVDPTQTINAGLTQGLVGGAFGAGRTFNDAKAAIKFRGISGEDPAHIAEAANRMHDAATNLDVNLASPKGGGLATKSAQTDVATEFKNAVEAIKGSGEDKNDLSEAAQKALARAQAGLPLSEEDAAALRSSSGEDQAVTDLQRLGGIARVLNGVVNTGHYNEKTGSLTGGLSGAMEYHVRALANPIGAGVSAGLAGFGGAHLGDAFAHSPEAIAALGLGYGGARLADWASGNRSPAFAFAKRFADPSVGITPAQIGSGAGLQQLDQQAAGLNPTGPRIPPAPTPWGTTPPEAQTPPSANPDPKQLLLQAKAMENWRKGIAAQQADQNKQTTAQALPLLQKLAAQNAPQPPAPPEAPQAPQINPIAMKMLQAQLKNPPQAPVEPAPQAPQVPQFNPIAMRMLAEKLKQAQQQPQAPVAPAQMAPVAAPAPEAAALVPAISKITKANGKVKVKQEPVQAPAETPAASAQSPTVPTDAAPQGPLSIPQDLSIPDFLKRTPVAQASAALAKVNGKQWATIDQKQASLGEPLQPVAATKAMAKLNERLAEVYSENEPNARAKKIGEYLAANYTPLRAGDMKPANVLKMSHEDYADYKLAQKEAQGKPANNPAAYRQTVIDGRSWKEGVAAKLAELFPQVERKLKQGFFGELETHNTRAPIEQLRAHLKSLDPSKADAVDELLSDTKLRSVWHVAGKR